MRIYSNSSTYQSVRAAVTTRDNAAVSLYHWPLPHWYSCFHVFISLQVHTVHLLRTYCTVSCTVQYCILYRIQYVHCSHSTYHCVQCIVEKALYCTTCTVYICAVQPYTVSWTTSSSP